MASEDPDARVLLRVAPDQYVTERARLVKQARADRDRPLANFFQALKRPSVPLWAVLTAGEDAEAVGKILTVTSELGDIQAAGSTATKLTAATKTRRNDLEAFVDRAVKSLTTWETGAEKRRPEIRAIVDQLSRHPELAESWIDATLRDLPEDEFGFGAFTDVPIGRAADSPDKDASPKQTKSTRKPTKPSAAAKPDRADERAARAARADEIRAARQDVAAASRELTVAERGAQTARSALRKAEKAAQLADEQRESAERRHDEASARLAAAQAAR
jgi:hypothetical protein